MLSAAYTLPGLSGNSPTMDELNKRLSESANGNETQQIWNALHRSQQESGVVVKFLIEKIDALTAEISALKEPKVGRALNVGGSIG